MSTETIKEFLVGLGFQVDEKSLGKFNTGIMKSGVAVVALGQIAADAARQVASAITELLNVNRYAEELEKINDVSERTKVAAEEIFRLGFQAEQTGSDMNALTSSLDGLTKVAGLAAMGMGRGLKVFEEIGIEVKDTNGKLKGTTVLMDEIREKIKGLESGQQQAILGRLGLDPTLVKMMTEDVSGLAAEYDEMVKASGFSASQAVKDADNYRDELGKLQTAVGLIGKTVASKLFNKMAESTERWRKLLVSNMPKIIEAISRVIKEILYVANIFATAGARIFAVVAGVVSWLSDVNDAMDGWLGKIALVLIAWRALNLGFLTTPLGMILSLAAALALLAEDFYVWKNGGDSLINWGQWENEIQLVIDLFGAFKDALSEAFIFGFQTIEAFWGIVTSAFTAITSAASFLAKLLTGDFSGAWRAVGESINAAISIFQTAFGWVMKLIDGVGTLLGLGGSVTTKLGDKIGNAANATFAASGFDAMGNPTGFGAAEAPSPTAAAALGGTNQSVTQKTDIIVQASPDAAATGRAVAGQQDRVNADMTRNLSPRAR